MLSYGCHLWDLSRVSTCHGLNTARTKAIQKGLAMKTKTISIGLRGWLEGNKKYYEAGPIPNRVVHNANAVV